MGYIAGLLLRVAKLYAIPDFREDSAVELADWIMEAYNCEPLELIANVLRNPPGTDKPNWRLTPDTIRQWMSDALEKQAEQLERQHEQMKKKSADELPQINYESFRKRLEAGEALQEPPKRKFDEGFEKFKAERARKQALKNKSENE